MNHAATRVQKNTTLSIKIPAGINNGDKMRIMGKGEAGINGGPSGDLYVQIRVKAHSIFKRDGQDLICEVPISIITAALGGDIEVPTITGKIKLKIPSETQSNSVFRLGGKGMPRTRRENVGDLLCRVMVETPVKLNATQKNHLREFDKLLNQGKGNHSPKSKRWFDTISNFFVDK